MRDPSGKYLFETPVSGTQYFAFSIMVPHDWQSPQHYPNNQSGWRWGIPIQLHGPDTFGASPSIALSLLDHYSLFINADNLDTLGKNHNTEYPFTDGGVLSPDAWDDFVLRITFAKDKTGAVTVWRRKAREIKFRCVADVHNIATLQTRPSVENTQAFRTLPRNSRTLEYWKQGYYRSQSPDVVSVLLETGLVRAASFKAAEKAAFGTQHGY